MDEALAKTKYSQEKIIYYATELYIEKNGNIPADVATLQNNGYIDSHFNIGSYTINVADNNTTVIICSNYDKNDSNYKNFYLHHYLGKEMGYAPYVDTGGNRDICHPYPFRIKTIDAL